MMKINLGNKAKSVGNYVSGQWNSLRDKFNRENTIEEKVDDDDEEKLEIIIDEKVDDDYEKELEIEDISSENYDNTSSEEGINPNEDQETPETESLMDYKVVSESEEDYAGFEEPEDKEEIGEEDFDDEIYNRNLKWAKRGLTGSLIVLGLGVAGLGLTYYNAVYSNEEEPTSIVKESSLGLWDRVNGNARAAYEAALAKNDSLKTIVEINEDAIKDYKNKNKKLNETITARKDTLGDLNSRNDSLETVAAELDSVLKYKQSLIEQYGRDE